MSPTHFPTKLLVLLLLTARLGHTDTDPTPSLSARTTSEVLFNQGKALLVEKRYAEACPLLQESDRLAPGVGVLLQLGLCLERSGKLAAGWIAYREAADRARAANDSARLSLAEEQASQLLGKLAFLTLVVREAGGEHPIPPHLEVWRDGEIQSPEVLGLSVPVDPGKHTLRATAPGRAEVTRELELSAGEHATLELDLPRLPKASPKPTISASVGRSTASEPASPHQLEPQRPMGPPAQQSDTSLPFKVALGVGVGSLMVGTVATAVAYARMRDAHLLCEGYSGGCPLEAHRVAERARGPATVANISFAFGVGALLFSGTWWLTHRHRAWVGVSGSPASASLTLGSPW